MSSSMSASPKLSQGAITVRRYRRGAGGVTEVVNVAPIPNHGFLVEYHPRISDRGWIDWHPAFDTAVAQLEGLAKSEGLGVAREAHAYYVWHKGDALYKLTAVVASPLPDGGAIEERRARDAQREREQAEHMQAQRADWDFRGEVAAQACREDNADRDAARLAAQWEGAAERATESARRAES